MRLKGINPIEQHAEKVVAGLFAVALLGVLTWQFIAKPNKVTVDKVEVELPLAYDQIAKTAKKVDDKLQATKPELPTPDQVKEVTKRIENFEKALREPVAPNMQLAGPLDRAVPIGGGERNKVDPNAPIAELKAPGPGRPVAATYLATISVGEAQNPEVAKVLPPAAPFDKAAVTVEAVFDGTALKTALEVDPDGEKGPIRAIPKNWWDTGVQIIAVDLLRQMLKPDGTWTPEEKLKGMPGRPLFVDKADTLNDAESRQAAIKFADEQSDMVRRTPYYAISIGETWAAPSERETLAAQGADKSQQIALKRNALKDKDKSIMSVEEAIKKQGQPGAAPPRPGGGGGDRGGGGGGRAGGGGGGGSGGTAPSATPPTGPSADDLAKKRLQDRLTKLKEERAKIVADLRDLGEIVEGDPGAPMQDTAKPMKVETPVLDNSAIRVWAHDVFAERGKTYRYRIALVLTNPYFGHSAAMVPAQAEKLAKSGVMRTAPSEWSEPVAVDPETYVYFTAAVEDDPSADKHASARAEVYQFKWGFWRRGWASLEPGDPVAVEVTVPDYSKFLAGAPQQGDPNAPAQPAPPVRPVAPGRGGGGTLAPSTQPAGSPPGTDAPSIPAGTTIPKVKVPVSQDVVMLGVGHSPTKAASGKSVEVFLRESNGQVRVVVPDTEKAEPAFVRVSRSADKGDLAAAPVEKPKPNVPGTQPTTQPDPGRDPHGAPPPGGG